MVMYCLALYSINLQGCISFHLNYPEVTAFTCENLQIRLGCKENIYGIYVWITVTIAVKLKCFQKHLCVFLKIRKIKLNLIVLGSSWPL